MFISTSATRRYSYFFAFVGVAVSVTTPSAVGQGRILSWGHDGSNLVSDSPAGTDFIQVAESAQFALALRTDGSIEAWGYEGTSDCVSGAPTDSGYTQIGNGYFHGLAIRADGSIHSWGRDTDGQVSGTPNGTGFTSVVGGWSFSTALHSDGSVNCWGTGPAVTNAPAVGMFTQIAAGIDHCLALRADGSIAAWGDDQFGQVSNTPTGTGFTMVAASVDHSHALRADGSIESWGLESNGIVSGTPTDAGYTQIAAGRFTAMALRGDGSIEIWGEDQAGVISGTPPGTGFGQLEAGGHYHCLALQLPTGSPSCFGDGTGAVCPCGANGGLGEGCVSTASTGATLFGAGSASISDDSFYLSAMGVPEGAFGLILRGANQLNNGLGIPAGDGLLCVGGQTARSQVQAATATGTEFYSFQGSPFSTTSYGVGIPTNYQYWYRDSANRCTGAGFNFSNAWTVVWSQ